MRLRELTRTSTFRLSSLYGLIFAIGLVSLLGLVYARSAVYLTRRVDSILVTEADALAAAPPAELRRRIDEAVSLGGDRTSAFGLFAPGDRRLAGNIEAIPEGLAPGGPPVEIGPTRAFPAPARLIARRLASGEVLVVGRDVDQLQEMRAILAGALVWSGAAVIVVGLACGIALSLPPLARLRRLQAACDDIAAGDLTRRLPTSRRRDELDTFASTVNYMLEEVERLLGEVKGASESIAHDLRTPLTRVRAQLHRLAQAHEAPPGELARVTAELDEVLERFRALMRIGELEARERRAGFARADLTALVDDAADLYQPLAEASGVSFAWSAPAGVTAFADAKLLFEAVSNLLDNAIKFAGAGGRVALRLESRPVKIVVEDNGPGIPAAERAAVLQRFYRVERDRTQPGSGLGLSIAAAIVRLHRFELSLEEAGPGLRAVISCGAGETLFTGGARPPR